jgi:hypothetical protein
VIVLDELDSFLKNRVMLLSEEQITGTHYNDVDMDRRLEAYRIANNSEIADPSVQQFFANLSIKIFEAKCSQEKELLMSSFKIYIERNEKPFNYMIYDKQLEEGRVYDNSTKQNNKNEEEQQVKRV